MSFLHNRKFFIYEHITGNDYSSGPYNVTIPAGTTSAFFVVPIIHDDLVEENEDFMLTINTELLPIGVTVGNPAVTTVTIVDNVGKDIHDYSLCAVIIKQ